PAKVRARMEYAFRVFAAIYGHAVVDVDSAGDPVRFRYGAGAGVGGHPQAISLPARYPVRSVEHATDSSAPPSFAKIASESIPLFLVLDPISGNPDWVGEIFLWLSGELELNAEKRDSVGRIPFPETPFAKFGISAERPYAALLMAWLENTLQRNDAPDLPKA